MKKASFNFRIISLALAIILTFSLAGCVEGPGGTLTTEPGKTPETSGSAGNDTLPADTVPVDTVPDTAPRTTEAAPGSVFPGFEALDKYIEEHPPLPDSDSPRYDGRHVDEYHGVNSDFTRYFFCDYLFYSPNYQLPSGIGFANECSNYGFFIDYFAISEEDFRQALIRYYESHSDYSLEAFVNENYGLAMYKHWFGDYADDPVFLVRDAVNAGYKSVTVRPHGEDGWTDLYYTIDYRLIQHVGKDKFESFKNKYGGSADFNIVNFLEEMGIGPEEYRDIYDKYYASIGRPQPQYNQWYPYPNAIFRSQYESEGMSEVAVSRAYSDGLFRALGRHPFNNRNYPLRTYLTRDAKHVAGYGYWDYENFWKELIDREDFGRYLDMFVETEDMNIGAIIDYFGISREDYLDAVEKFKKWIEDGGGGMDDSFYEWVKLVDRADDWFAEDYADRECFVLEGYEYPEHRTVTHVPDNCAKHTGRYHTIDHTLIELVGAEKFKEFEDKYAGTEDFNVVRFIEYFELGEPQIRAKFASELTDVFKCMPYSPYFLFADRELRNEYFTKK